MFRKTAIVVPIMVLASVTACGSGKNASDTTATRSAMPAATASAAAAVACPAHTARHFAKTRFTADAALAGGAFKRYIYTPFKEGKFKKGADGRVTATAKAVAAGTFMLNRLGAAGKDAQASPALCKATAAPMRKLETAVKGLVAKGKSGSLSAPDVTSPAAALDAFRVAAAGAGAGFKDNTAAGVG